MRLFAQLAQPVRMSSSLPSTTLLGETRSSSGRAASTRSSIGIQLLPLTKHWRPSQRIGFMFRRIARRISRGVSALFLAGKSSLTNPRAPGSEIGKPGDTYRRICIESTFGKLAVFVTDGHLPYPYGREITVDGRANLGGPLGNGKTAVEQTLIAPFTP